MEQNTNQTFTNEGASKNKGMAVLSYFGILALIPYFAAKNDQWVRFHAVQGLNLWLISLITSIFISVLSTVILFIPGVGEILAGILGIVSAVLSIVFFVISILGIVSAVKGESKELPIVSKIRIIK